MFLKSGMRGKACDLICGRVHSDSSNALLP
jgi:hypothetical protein